MVESILFGLFVVAIGCDQMQAIFTDETAIEHVKKQGPYRPQKPKMQLMSEVFGKGPAILWLLPCQFRSPNLDSDNSYTV